MNQLPEGPKGPEEQGLSGSLDQAEAPSYRDRVFASAEACYHMQTQWTLALMAELAEVERHNFYRAAGFESTEDWFCSHFGVGYNRACEFVDVALALDRFPKLKEAYRSGAISYDHLRALVKVATEDNEADLLREAEGLTVGATFAMVRRMTPVSEEDSRFARNEKWLEKRWDLDRRVLLLNAQLPEDLGAKVERAIDSLAKKMGEDPSMGAMPTPMGAKMADALVEMASSALGSVPGRATVVVHVDPKTLLGEVGVGELEEGPTICPETARRLACDSVIRLVTRGKDGRPVALGGAGRTVPGRLAAEVRRRDKTCLVPQCRKRRLLEFHHIVHRENDGQTTYDNIILVCETHHHMVHEGGYQIRGVPPKIWLEHPQLPPIKVGLLRE